MNEPGFPRLDPGAQEFFPTTGLFSVPPQIFHPYPPPMYDNMGYAPPQFPPPPPPPPPLPISFPPPLTTPSRTLLLSMVPASVSESTVRRELEVFGDVRAVQMERRREGLVTVHFYDVRDAQAALAAIQEQHMQQQFRLGRHYDAVWNNSMSPPLPPQTARGLISGRVVWAQFTAPMTSGLPDGNNQGTLVIFNLEPRVSPVYLKEIFEVFGPVKELRETPNKRNQRFVEFYDVRNAAKAIAEMNGKEIYGKTVVIEFSRPGGQKSWKGPQNCANKFNYPANNNSSSRNPLRFSPPSSRPENNELSIQTTRPPRNFHSKGNPSGSTESWSTSGSSSLQESLTNLSIGNNGYKEECSSGGIRPHGRKNNKYSSKKSNNDGGGRGGLKQSGHGGSRPWRRGKDDDPRFLIKEDAIVESDLRTTVMIKNIPNKYSQKLLLNMLDNHCIHCNEQMADEDGDDHPLSSYDFVYLPIDFINKCNVGYGFVNMTSPQATLRLYKAFHHQNWEVFNSRKICQVTYARLQGLEALREHFKNSKFPEDAEEYMPVVFSPPRDGRILSDPVPINGRVVDNSPSENQSEPQIGQLYNGHIDNPSYDVEGGTGTGNDEKDE